MEHLEEVAVIEGRGDGLLDLASSTELRIQPFLVRLTPFDLIIPERVVHMPVHAFITASSLQA